MATLEVARIGHPVCEGTVRNWVVRGKRTDAGRVHLEHERRGGTILTSREAVARFLKRTRREPVAT